MLAAKGRYIWHPSQLRALILGISSYKYTLLRAHAIYVVRVTQHSVGSPEHQLLLARCDLPLPSSK